MVSLWKIIIYVNWLLGNNIKKKKKKRFLVYLGFGPITWSANKQLWASFFQHLLSFGVTMSQPWLLLLILFSTAGLSTLKVDYRFIQEHVLRRDILVKYIATDDQLANAFTKSLPIARIQFL